MKRWLPILLIGLLAVLIGIRFLPNSRTQNDAEPPQNQQPQQQQQPAETPKEEAKRVGIVLGLGGRGDKSFNDAAIRGLDQAKEELNITYRDIEPREMASDEEALRFLVDQGFDLIIGVGFTAEDSIRTVARDNPNSKFAIIDAVVDEPNVASLVYKEHEGSFLAGALAAMVSETKSVGFVGGMDTPLIRKFQIGYEEGARYINPDMIVLANYVGSDPGAFNNPGRGKELALAQFDRGADIVYHAAGGSGSGVIDAAQERSKLAIGVDSDQDDLAPGFVLTSMIKKVDVSVFDVVKDLIEGKFEGGAREFGVANEGVGLTDFRNTRDRVSDETIQRLEEIKQKISSGEIQVPSSR